MSVAPADLLYFLYLTYFLNFPLVRLYRSLRIFNILRSGSAAPHNS